MVGDNHLDLKKYDRISSVLSRFKPDTICLDTTKKDFNDVKQTIELYFSESDIPVYFNRAKKSIPSLNKETFNSFLSSQFGENQAISDYVTNINTLLLFYESDLLVNFFVKSAYGDAPKNLSFLENFLSLPLKEALLDIEKDYSQDVYPVKDISELVSFYQKRDKFAFNVISSQISYSESVVCFGGLDHFFGDYHPNLADRLSVFNPKLFKLNEFD